ncbi:hypothetical protein BSL78_28978, partial [Apostichopus japonicus]
GPALCSWNNAVFTEQDWKGIQTPSQSGKKNDVLKVGRFGIGFSSVYHLTDLPCIVSQRYIAMIDPCEKYFKDEKVKEVRVLNGTLELFYTKPNTKISFCRFVKHCQLKPDLNMKKISMEPCSGFLSANRRDILLSTSSPGEESKSGLPVHVHGFFGVSDDRRSLKWPGGDQIQNEEAEWNTFLVDELLPQAYCKALVEATKVSVINSIHPDVVYAAFPDTRKDLGHWKTAVERLYRDLVHHPVVYCHSKDAWMELNEVVILPESFRKTPDIKEAVMKCLQLREHSVIETLPDHVRCALIKYWPEAEVVSVDFVLNCTRLIALEEVSREKRLHLLRYLLENGCVAKHLNGLALIPTDDGEFAQFVENPTKSDIIFMGTTKCPQELLPNMQGSFLQNVRMQIQLVSVIGTILCSLQIRGNNLDTSVLMT